MSRKVIYYSDALNDDFAGTDISARTIDGDYEYIKSSVWWKTAAFFVYRVFATPVVWLLCKAVCGLRIRNRKVVQKLKGKGFFMYGNHTNGMADAFTPTLCAFPHRAHIVTSPDAVSLRGLGEITAMLGAMPVPGDRQSMRNFRAAIETRYSQQRAIAIYPEAHIWPYYTGVRPFSATSFQYPVRLNAPCVAFVATYRQRRILKSLPPLMTITLSEPFYPDAELSEHAAKKKLRDEIYSFMAQTVGSPDNYSYVDYVEREAPEAQQMPSNG